MTNWKGSERKQSWHHCGSNTEISWREWEKPRKISVGMLAGAATVNRNEDLPNTSTERYRCSSLLGFQLKWNMLTWRDYGLARCGQHLVLNCCVVKEFSRLEKSVTLFLLWKLEITTWLLCEAYWCADTCAKQEWRCATTWPYGD